MKLFPFCCHKNPKYIVIESSWNCAELCRAVRFTLAICINVIMLKLWMHDSSWSSLYVCPFKYIHCVYAILCFVRIIIIKCVIFVDSSSFFHSILVFWCFCLSADELWSTIEMQKTNDREKTTWKIAVKRAIITIRSKAIIYQQKKLWKCNCFHPFARPLFSSIQFTFIDTTHTHYNYICICFDSTGAGL